MRNSQCGWAFGRNGIPVVHTNFRATRQVSEKNYCEVLGCGNKTSDHKPYCTAHIMKMPAAQEAVAGLEQ